MVYTRSREGGLILVLSGPVYGLCLFCIKLKTTFIIFSQKGSSHRGVVHLGGGEGGKMSLILTTSIRNVFVG